jgi:hypothetical protein
MYRDSIQRANGMLLASLLASSVLVSTAMGQVKQVRTKPGPSRFRATAFSNHARDYYQVRWGVDSLGVKMVESGQMIRFSYRIIDPEKAKEVNDKKQTPALVDERARVSLVVPQMEKVGQLRQSSTPEAGKSYWMVFSNKGNFVKRGDRVSVIIGKFRVDNLLVQ